MPFLGTCDRLSPITIERNGYAFETLSGNGALAEQPRLAHAKAGRCAGPTLRCDSESLFRALCRRLMRINRGGFRPYTYSSPRGGAT